MRRFTSIALAVSAAGCWGYEQKTVPSPAPSPAASAPTTVETKTDEENGHHHAAPHGGTLVEIGDHFGHLEFVLDSESGTLTMYALDGEAEHGVPLRSIGVVIRITVEGKEPVTLTLKPVANVLTGETEQATSQYAAQSDALKGVTAFTAVLPELDFRGMQMENFEIKYPSKENDE